MTKRPLDYVLSYGWAAAAAVCGLCAAMPARAVIIEHDTLEVGVAPRDDALIDRPDFFNFLASDAEIYDDNIYRLAPSETNLAALPGVGPNAHREDSINTSQIEGTGQYSVGRQIFVADLIADYNRYDKNDNLNNWSSADKLVWNWTASSLLTGQLGADYNRSLAGFVNTSYFNKDVIEYYDYFGTGRFQVGPHWAIFAGALGTQTTLSAAQLRGNDNHTESVDAGTEYTLSPNDTVGIEYRYTDARFNSLAQGNDFQEDNGRVYTRYEWTEKTSFDGSVGWLKRDYTDRSTIEGFSGYVWRFGAHWKVSDKFLLEADGSRALNAYVTAESEYFVSTGGELSLQWEPTEKIQVLANYGVYSEKYVGVGGDEPLAGSEPRHDTLSRGGASIDYTPFRFLILELGYVRERRTSNQYDFIYNDNQYRGKITVKY